MAAKRPLKVFVTSIGFADAYIAAPSQKAALEAWGADRNLFAAGMAERVTDPNLAKAALASPGKVIRVSKGTTAEYLAAAKASDTARRKDKDPSGDKPDNQLKPAKSKPRPSRQKLDEARAALEQRRGELHVRRAEIEAQIEDLRAERARVKAEGDAEIAKLDESVARQEKAYRQALDRWQG